MGIDCEGMLYKFDVMRVRVIKQSNIQIYE